MIRVTDQPHPRNPLIRVGVIVCNDPNTASSNIGSGCHRGQHPPNEHSRIQGVENTVRATPVYRAKSVELVLLDNLEHQTPETESSGLADSHPTNNISKFSSSYTGVRALRVAKNQDRDVLYQQRGFSVRRSNQLTKGYHLTPGAYSTIYPPVGPVVHTSSPGWTLTKIPLIG